MHAIWAIATKDMRLLVRDRIGFFFAFFFPLIVAVFFGAIFSGGGGGGKPQRIAVAVFDLDGTAGSAAFVRDLADGNDLAVTPASSREQGLRSVREGEVAACIVLPQGFGAAREAPFAGRPMEIEVGIDPSRKATAGMLEGILTKYGFMQLQAGFEDPSKMRAQTKQSLASIEADPSLDPIRKAVFRRFFANLDAMLAAVPPADAADGTGGSGEGAARAAGGGSAWQPLRIVNTPVATAGRGPSNVFAITFPQGVIWGVMGCALGFSIALVTERTRGTLIRLRVAPIAPWRILAGKALACFLSTMAVATVLMVIAAVGFGVRPTSVTVLAAALVCTCFCFVGVMNLLAVFSTSERSGNGLGWGVLLVLSMIGGGMLPLEFMPDWMLTLSAISPIKWALLAIEGGVWRGLSMRQIALPCAILLAIGAAGFVAGVRVFGTAERTS